MNRREFSKTMAGFSPLLLSESVRSILFDTAQPATHATPALRKFEQLQFGVSFHFSMNTFTGDDYDVGAAPATTYNPTHLDVRQWIQVSHDLGARYAVLTAKHMSGFCLWDSANYDYDVAASGNKTDVVAAFVASCREYGLQHGFYYCILDPHNEGKFDWNSPVPDKYYELIKHHLTELHSQYPNTFYQLLDITWKLSKDQRWEIYRLIKKYSRQAIVVMNQAYYQSKRNLGRVCEPASWPTDVINAEDTLPALEGHDPHVKFEGETYYLPMESWIPTGPPYKPVPPMHSWFWRPGLTIQSAETIASAYSDCRNRHANLLLNLSPDRTGRLSDEAVRRLHEAWFQDERWYDLIVILDDATSEIYYAQLVEEESTQTVMAGLKEVIERKGVFCARYSDRGSHFWRTPKVGGRVDPHRLTQVGRALRELGVQMIPAYSPQARGRSERNFGTWQGRLPQELRLAGITSLEAANGFLRKHYMAEFNRRFQVAAPQAGSAFVAHRTRDLDLIFALQFERTVNRDNTVSFQNLHLQIEAVRWRGSLAGCTVTVHQHLDGSITLTHGPHRLGCYSAQGVPLSENKLGRGGAVEKPRGGKVQKPTFPPRLEIPQKPRDSHFPTAPTAAGRLPQTGHITC